MLLISGPAGVGKSTVAHELSRQLAHRGTPHALIDTDELDRIYRAPSDLSRVTEGSLWAVWAVLSRYGARPLILVGVYLDRRQEREWIARALPGAQFTCVRLSASPSSLRERVLRREIGSGAEEQLERTMRQLAVLGSDSDPSLRVITTDDRPPNELAAEIVAMWPPDAH